MLSRATVDLEQILPRVTRPARYTNGEWNAVVKDWAGAQVRVALVYPDLYELGATSYDLASLYDLLNQRSDALAERAYVPWPDMEQEMERSGIPLFGLESRRPLGQFDVIFFTLSHELTYTNVLTALNLAGLPLAAAERTAALPLVVAGGRCALNPEPLADFVDAFILGDAEEPMQALVEQMGRFKSEGASREELLRALPRTPGVYVPSLYQIRYGGDGTVAAVEETGGAPPRPRVHRASSLPAGPRRPVVPFMQTAHDRAVLEVQRGVAVGCRCCQMGVDERPLLLRSAAETLALAQELLASTGHSELYLLAPTPCDGQSLLPVLQALKGELGEWVTISTPSLALGGLGEGVARALAAPGRTTIACTPEGASPRLRQMINRPAEDAEVLSAAEVAFRHGFSNLRLHLKVGLPTETPEELRGLAALAGQVRAIGERYHRGRAHVRISAVPFVPRPHTPFQWASQETPEELEARQALLRRACRRAGVDLWWEETKRSLLEAALARGDRRLGAVVRRAWERGCRLDAWREFYRWERWEEAFADLGLAPAFYAQRQPAPGEMLPWSHIDTGVSEELLRSQWQQALVGAGRVDNAHGEGAGPL